jgi:hypothetical protein
MQPVSELKAMVRAAGSNPAARTIVYGGLMGVVTFLVTLW